MILRFTLLLLLLCPAVSMAGGYLEELTRKIDEFNMVISKNSKYGIYSPPESEVGLNYIEKIIHADEASRAIVELRAAGKEFLAFLEASDDAYKYLSVDEWLTAVELLLDFDEVISRKLAWGNLIIKIAICNKIFNWAFDYVDSYKENIESDILNKLLDVQVRLRMHYPSNTSMFYIAFRYYGINIGLHATDYVLNVPYSKELEQIQKLLKLHFKNNVNDLNKLNEITKRESSVAVKGYTDLYDHPLPVLVAYRTDFYPDSWGCYEYLKVVLADTKISSSKDITKDDLYDFLSEEYRGNGAFWMPYTAVNLVKKPESYSGNYLNSTNKELLLDSIRRVRKLTKQRKIMKGNEIFGSRLW